VSFAKKFTVQICVQGVMEELAHHRYYNSVLQADSYGHMANVPERRKCSMASSHYSLKRLVTDLAWTVVQTTAQVADLTRAVEEPELAALQMLSKCH
jgi:hypothetical protein